MSGFSFCKKVIPLCHVCPPGLPLDFFFSFLAGECEEPEDLPLFS
jgi:hypothetical protein